MKMFRKTKRWPFLLFAVSIVFYLFPASCVTAYEIDIRIDSKESLMRIGTIPLFVTEDGKRTASFLWSALEKRDMGAVREASDMYGDLLRNESRTGDYGSLKWLCECIVASDKDRKGLITDELSRDFYRYFTDNEYSNLKEYLLRKYKVNDYNPQDVKDHLDRRSYLEDLMMFNNPTRNDWERSEEIIGLMGLKKGDRIADIGCGFGYYSYRFSSIVGSSGKVWAVDTNEAYIRYIEDFVKNRRIKNMVPVVSKISDISVNDQIDVAFMCSVYHIVYGWSTEADRVPFLSSIKRSLKPGGLLVIADNSFAGGNELNSCYIDKDLALAQLAFYGFSLVRHVQITPQRYVLILRHEQPDQEALNLYGRIPAGKASILKVRSGNSVVHIGSLDSYDITERGIEAAKLVYEALRNKDLAAAKKAIVLYDELIPVENYGGEYTALQWFCEYMTATDPVKRSMLEDPLVRTYYDYLAEGDFKLLRRYVDFKYRLSREKEEEEKKEKKEMEGRELKEEDREIGRTKREFLEDFILFNNPRRKDWEKTGKIMDLIRLKEGDVVADIGSGSGYYTYRFSKLVGEAGKVYAIDVKQEHLDFIQQFAKEQKIGNIRTIKSRLDDICLQTKADWLFMCSLYHIIYAVSSESERAGFIESIKKAMKKDSRLIIVDNGPVEDETMPYHGPYISKELIIYQLERYGFMLEGYDQTIPQRYVLTFRLKG